MNGNRRLVATFSWLFLILVGTLSAVLGDVDLSGISPSEWRGYYRREHSIAKPYQGTGVDVPYWDITGSTMVTPNQVRLTADQQSKMGAIWNRMPVNVRDWEVMLSFKVTGATGDMFGDGLAFWYTADRMTTGPVFGNKDYFRGLAVFLDTYSNHNGPHTHSHPYVTAMVSNGSAHYDHDRDGTHTQLGGDHVGCEAKFRNKKFDTNILIRYVGDTLSVYIDVTNESKWKKCLSVDHVFLPTGYFIGVSAATGDLSDAHDVIGIKTFEQEFVRVETQQEGDVDRSKIEPSAELFAAPRDHVDSPRPSRLGWLGATLLVVVALVVVAGVLGFGLFFLQKRSEHSRKRFY